MAKKRIAINGFGRIGRAAFKIILDQVPDMEIVAINDLTDLSILAYLLKHDSVYHTYQRKIEVGKNSLLVDGQSYQVLAERDPLDLPWKELNVDLVLECTGFFTLKEEAAKHLQAGARKVLISAPSKSPEMKTLVLGVNEQQYDSIKDDIISNASCTTNALAPALKVLRDHWKIKKGMMTTIHSYTSTQRLVDSPVEKDLRRGRGAAINLIPTTTGASIATTKVIPELVDHLDGIAIRVPTPVVSIVDLVVQFEKSVTSEEINQAFASASKGNLQDILAVSDQPLVSSDYIQSPYSAIVDLSMTRVVAGDLAKIIIWYDNEWGYSVGLVKMANLMIK